MELLSRMEKALLRFGERIAGDTLRIAFWRVLAVTSSLSVISATAVNLAVYMTYWPERISANWAEVLLVPVGIALALTYPATLIAFLIARGMADAGSKMRQQAETDFLTGVATRRHFQREVTEALAPGGAEGVLLVLDLDHFKNINDIHGHDFGDSVLSAAAGAMRAALRRSDLIGRLGGEEFAVFLPDAGRAEAEQLAHRLRKAISDLSIASESGPPVRITVSIGLVETAGQREFRALYRHADGALYKAKVGGRNRIATASGIDQTASLSLMAM